MTLNQPGDADAAPDASDEPLSLPRREVNAEMLASEPAPKKRAVAPTDDDAEAVVPDAADDGDDDNDERRLGGKELIRAQVDARIDAALKSGKRRTNRRRTQGEDDLDLMADEEVSALRTEMIIAADEDEEANRYKQPATSKLRLLPRVVSTLQKYVYKRSFSQNAFAASDHGQQPPGGCKAVARALAGSQFASTEYSKRVVWCFGQHVH